MLNKLCNLVNGLIYIAVTNLYSKPKAILKLLFHPTAIYGVNYYPEKEEKSKFHILWDQCVNIFRYGYVDEFYYLYGLNIKNFRKKEDYLVYGEFMRRRDKLNLSTHHNSSCILRNKLYFGVFAAAFGVDTPENIAYIRNGDILLLGKGEHTSIELFISTYEGTFFCKPMDGECGMGVFKLEINSGCLKINDNNSDISTLIKMLDGVDFLIQRCITQHPVLSKLHPSSINSMRLVTVRSLKDNKIYVLPSILRIGTNGSIVDNTSQGGVAVGFNLTTGRLNEYGLQKPQVGLRFDTHPNSKIKFADYTIPFIKETIEQAKYFHSFLNLHSIGWDVAIGENGPIFIEGNDNWEINGPQSCNCGLVKYFKEYFYR